MQLVFACWQAWIWVSWPAWTWLSWPAWTWFLTGLFMHVGTDCSWLDERTDLNNVVGTIMINQQPCSCMMEHVVREWWNNTIGQRCYNNDELGCCVKSGVALPKIREQPPSIRQLCWNMIECSIMPTVLLHGSWENNSVRVCDIFTCVIDHRWSHHE